jgi:hypothetical protein
MHRVLKVDVGLVAIAVAGVLVAFACGDDDGGSNNQNQSNNNNVGEDAAVQHDAAVQNDGAVQADAGAGQLTTSHSGWNRADCATGGCHDKSTQHGGLYDWPDCAGCHGANMPNSKLYPSGHHGSGCLSCHPGANSGTHSGYTTYVPAGCIACHTDL